MKTLVAIAMFSLLGACGGSLPRLSPEGQLVDIRTAAPSCQTLGTVSGSYGMNFRSPTENTRGAQAKNRNDAAKLGADTVVITSQQVGTGSGKGACTNCVSIVAQAYTCGPNAGPLRPAAGCAHDNQCKGDRVCEKGRCMSPPR